MSRAARRALPGLFALGLLAACGSPGGSQGGLTNAPAANRPWGPDDLGEDAIANGPDGCPRKPGDPDPLPNRLGSCGKGAGERAKARPVASAR